MKPEMMTQMITTAWVIAGAVGLKIATYRLLIGVVKKFKFKRGRNFMISRILNFSILSILALILLGIWEVDPEDLTLYLASIFTVIGVAFFAQWSHLSNVTAGVILFFSHPVKVGDMIVIHEGDNPLSGRIDDISPFFVTIITESDEQMLISNSLFLQKVTSIRKIKRKKLVLTSDTSIKQVA